MRSEGGQKAAPDNTTGDDSHENQGDGSTEDRGNGSAEDQGMAHPQTLGMTPPETRGTTPPETRGMTPPETRGMTAMTGRLIKNEVTCAGLRPISIHAAVFLRQYGRQLVHHLANHLPT